jgi:hypothetical protein
VNLELKLKSYNNYGKKEKQHILPWVIGEAVLIFLVATASIILYDIYINIDASPSVPYVPERISKEVNAENETNLSEILESVSKSVVRNI